jgi:mannosyltransferase OCH1-like enzyme
MISFKNNKIKSQQILEEQIKECKDKIEKHNSNVKIFNTYNRLNIPFQLKSTYNSIIPLHLYTCWHTKDLPPLMRENYNFFVESNPKITFHLYDEEDCREFIKNNFEPDVLEAYNSLIPCSYKSDLWRFCVLYINGGIYMDIKYRCVNNFKFIALTEKEHFIRDYGGTRTHTGLIVTLPQNEIMRKCIYQIVENVKHKYFGNDPLYPTGPNLLGRYFSQEEKNYMEMYHDVSKIENKLNKSYLVKVDRIILRFYDNYREEQSKFQNLKHYSQLWEEKSIYK